MRQDRSFDKWSFSHCFFLKARINDGVECLYCLWLLGRASARPQLGGQRRRCHDIYIDRPSDFRSSSLNRRLTASCFVVSAQSLRDTHDASGSCRPKVCLCEVVELQKQEKNYARNFWGLVPVRQGRSEVKQLLWLVLNIEP